ncbi:MAG: Gfo/Idh/MocA family oxidoreductase [Cyanobacteria bacterium SZAS LIN-3]|nr:Gfo/Idh/MocA family oxidoreductase [Cyanobacteria bacterium SZAS LIN-3]
MDMDTSTVKIRFAVIGLGHIAQIAVLPAFAHARETCELTAFISDDEEKLTVLSKKYKVENCWNYGAIDEALASDSFDAVYIALPNDMHREYAVKAAAAGKHVLCEKPLAMNEEECLDMIKAAEEAGVKLMTAYRLHFEKTNMEAVDLINSGKIGRARLFNSSFTMQVRDGNIRTQASHGGGPLYDLGIYCINAARYLFGAEPTDVAAAFLNGLDERFEEIEESASVIMRFPDDRVASFLCSFGTKDASWYEVLGTLGSIRLEPAYDYSTDLKYEVKIGEKTESKCVKQHDQFAPELLHFADCILNDKEPRPSGYEGLADLRVIDAIHQAAENGQWVKIAPACAASRPDGRLIEMKPKVSKPPLVNVKSGSIS